MATIKSYTDVSQSKVLAKILPLESADMYYPCEGVSPKFGVALSISNNIPCWSLASLLSVLDFPSLTQNKEYEWEVCVFDHDNDDYIEKTASNPVDACYNMILKLHELKML